MMQPSVWCNSFKEYKILHWWYICFVSHMHLCGNLKGIIYWLISLHWRHSKAGDLGRHCALTIVYSTIYSGADRRNHQSSASLAFVRGIHHWPVNSPNKWPVTWKMLPYPWRHYVAIFDCREKSSWVFIIWHAELPTRGLKVEHLDICHANINAYSHNGVIKPRSIYIHFLQTHFQTTKDVMH